MPDPVGDPFRILLIEDNPADAALFQLAWSECKVVNASVAVLDDSRDAIKWLRGADPYPQRPAPDLVLLDYKMPVNGGIALTEIKGDPDYMHLPVIVVSGSVNNRDFFDAYQRGANCCYRKPFGLDNSLNLMCHIAETWLVHAVLPRR